MSPRIQFIEKVCRSASTNGMKLALWQYENQWHWQWKWGNVIVSSGWTDAQPKSMALLMACEDIGEMAWV